MAIINEIPKGELPDIAGVFMFRMYNSDVGFKTTFKLDSNGELDVQNNIVVPYIQYYKNSNNERLDSRLPVEFRYYVVPNRPATYWQVGEQIVPHTYYSQGDVMPELVVALGGEIIPNSNPEAYYTEGETMAAGTIALGGEIKVGTGTEIKTPAWMAANNWFLSLAQTPITAPYGIMDSIEATLAALPQNVPNGYKLQGQ